MPHVTVRHILAGTGVPLTYLDGLAACGIDLDAPAPLTPARRDGPDVSPIVAGLLKVAEYARTHQKISAIKELRALFGLGLKESKDIIDAFYPPPY